MNKRKIGAKYENIAADYLRELGYKILEQNYHNAYGEIDIIAEEEKQILVYCEIKFRSNSVYGNPLEAVDLKKQKKICRTALCHYAKYGYYNSRPCRFDVIAIYNDERIEHIKDAFYFKW